MKTNFRYPYEVRVERQGETTIGEMEEFIYDRFAGDFSVEHIYNWQTRQGHYRFWFEKRDEAVIFKITFTGGF